MIGTIQEKKNKLYEVTQYSQNRRTQLLEIIRTNPDYFNQFLTHIGDEKVEQFLDKEPNYSQSKKQIEKLNNQIEDEEMKLRAS